MNIPISDFNRGFIIGLKIADLNTSQISRILEENELRGCQKTINRLWNEWQQEKKQSPQFKSNQGRKMKLQEDSQKARVQFVQQNPDSSRKELQNSYLANPQQVSCKTLTNYLNNNGFLQQSVKKQINITKRNKKLRVAWARELLKMRRKNINGSIFTHETLLHFEDQNKSFKWVNKDLNMQKGCKSKERWPKKCLVWCAIHKSGDISLNFVQGNINLEKYLNILQNFYNKYAQNYDFTCFQEDNAPSHSSEDIKNFFKSYNISKLPWASQIPDINPIERVWGCHKHKLSKQVINFESFEEFKKAVKNLFLTDKEIQQSIRQSIEGVPNNLMNLIQIK